MNNFLLTFCIPLLCVGTICSQKSDHQINIPGTKLYLTPTVEFKLSKKVIGLEKDANTLINVLDLADGNYYSNARNFTEENFTRRGVSVIEFDTLTISGYPAKMVHMTAGTGLNVHNLVFGDSTFSISIQGVYLSSDKATGEEVKSIMLGATYDKNLVIDPLANALFSIDDSASRLKFAGANANMFFYTVDGKESNDLSKGFPIMLVTTLPSDEFTTPQLVCEQMLNGLIQQGFENTETLSRSNAKINGYEAYELATKGNLDGNISTHLVIFAVKGKDTQAVVQGMIQGEFLNFDEFRALVKTIEVK